MLRVFERPSQELRAGAEMVGYLAMVLGANAQSGRLPVRYLLQMLSEAWKQRNLKVYFNSEGIPVGYSAWAYISPATARRIAKSGQCALAPEEWNEGPITWVIDIAAPRGHLKSILHDLRDVVLKDEDVVRYVRVRNGRPIVKEISRSSNSYFFAPSQAVGTCTCGLSSCPGYFRNSFA